jgi:Family of unknown function (DUF6230)
MTMSPPAEPAETPSVPSEPTTSRRGRVRWRRAAALGVPTVLAGGALMVLTAQGVLGNQLYISGMPFTVTADKLVGYGYEQYGQLDNMPDHSPNAGDTGGQVLVVVSAIRKATLTNLCQSVDLGGTNLLIRAGTGATKVSAEHLATDSTLIQGDASFNGIEIGNDAHSLTKAGVKGTLGVFGQQADKVVINHLRQTNYETTAAVFKLPGLHLSFSDTGC